MHACMHNRVKFDIIACIIRKKPNKCIQTITITQLDSRFNLNSMAYTMVLTIFLLLGAERIPFDSKTKEYFKTISKTKKD